MATRIIEVSEAGARRLFSDEDKARIVSEAMMPGVRVADVARRNRICTSLIYRWRRFLLREHLAVEAPRLPFVPVEISSQPAAPPQSGTVEVMAVSGARIRLTPPIEGAVLKAVLAAVR